MESEASGQFDKSVNDLAMGIYEKTEGLPVRVKFSLRSEFC